MISAQYSHAGSCCLCVTLTKASLKRQVISEQEFELTYPCNTSSIYTTISWSIEMRVSLKSLSSIRTRKVRIQWKKRLSQRKQSNISFDQDRSSKNRLGPTLDTTWMQKKGGRCLPLFRVTSIQHTLRSATFKRGVTQGSTTTYLILSFAVLRRLGTPVEAFGGSLGTSVPLQKRRCPGVWWKSHHTPYQREAQKTKVFLLQ